MAKGIAVSAEQRSANGTTGSRRLRRSGVVPAVVYGDGKPGLSIQLDRHQFEKTMGRHLDEHPILDLDVKGVGAKKVLLQDVQYHPLSGLVIHVDFHEVSMTKKLRVEMAIRLVGEAHGVTQQGGVLEHLLRVVMIECLPTDILEHVDVDVSGLSIGQSLNVRNIVLDSRQVPHGQRRRPRRGRGEGAARRGSGGDSEAAPVRPSPRCCARRRMPRAKAPRQARRGRRRKLRRPRMRPRRPRMRPSRPPSRLARRPRSNEARPRHGRRRPRHEAGGRAGQPGARLRAHPPQRGLRGGGRAGAPGRSGVSAQLALAGGHRGGDAGPGSKVLLVKPQAYMNRSGPPVAALAGKRGVKGAPRCWWWWTTWSCRPARCACAGRAAPGGHNGLKSVVAGLGSEAFARLRVGVGRPAGSSEMVDHVLTRYTPAERETMGAALVRAADAVQCVMEKGLDRAMNEFNG
jgi:large subunit ribosomal protein L25